MRQVFCPNDNKEGEEDDCCWKWHREHFILGVAVKDTCVTAVYREASSATSLKKKKKKRKNNNQVGRSAGGDDRPEKRAKKEQSTTSDSTSSQTNESSETTSPMEGTDKAASSGENINDKDTPLKNGSTAHNKKPAGYTFLTPSKSSQMCAEIIKNSRLEVHKNNTAAPPPNNYMHTHLRIPQYISTLIVPTFSLDYPEIKDDTNANTDDATKESVAGDDQDKRKKYVPKKEQSIANPKKQKQQQQQQTQKGTVVIPNSTKDTMPVNTPHGWQKLRPEQYWDAVVSLTAENASDDNGSTTALPLPSGTANAAATAACPPTTTLRCEGAVGLFDHMGIPRNQINYLFDKFMNGKSSNNKHSDNDNEGGNGSNATAALTPQAQKALSRIKSNPPIGKWDTYLQRLVQRTNDWSIRTTQKNNGDERTPQERTTAASPSSSSLIQFWTPVQLAASYLPPQSLFARFRSRGMHGMQQRGLPSEKKKNNNGGFGPTSDNVAIVGWDAISYGREHKRRTLLQLMNTMRSASPTPRQYLVISVCDLQSMLDAARGGVSIIGTDMVRLWSRDGRALCLDLTLGNAIDDKEKNDKPQAEGAKTTGGMMDLREERYARDSLPILRGCEFKAPVLSFSRAYIHHLIKAKEMLAETLLFVHNLHQVLLLMRRLSEAASLDDCSSGEDGRSKGRLEAFCRWIEEQL